MTKTEKDLLYFLVCFSYSFKDMNEVSNMAIIEAGPLSGFEAREEDVKTVKFMKSVEMAGGRIVIYFDQVSWAEHVLKGWMQDHRF